MSREVSMKAKKKILQKVILEVEGMYMPGDKQGGSTVAGNNNAIDRVLKRIRELRDNN